MVRVVNALDIIIIIIGKGYHHHQTTSNATLPHNANPRYPPHRHTLPNEHQWEEIWENLGLYSSRSQNVQSGAVKS